MKDPHDKTTIDALDLPRRGRPRKEGALSNAERQRRHRAKLKAERAPGTDDMTRDRALWLLGCMYRENASLRDALQRLADECLYLRSLLPEGPPVALVSQGIDRKPQRLFRSPTAKKRPGEDQRAQPGP